MNDIEIYTLGRCPYCTRAKELFHENGLKFKEHDISNKEEEMREKLKAKFHLKERATVPQIVINGNYVGGYSHLKELFKSGELKNLLR